jgi:nucleoid-associated protein YgaU
MKLGKLFAVIGCLFLAAGLAGCTVRTYSLTRDRIDQDLSGNRGYLAGTAPADTGERKTQRTTRVVELEIGPKARPCSAAPIKVEQSTSTTSVESRESEVTSEAPVEAASEKSKMVDYKVKKGDTLQKISQHFYGTTKKWNKIFNANKDKLSAPDKIIPGQIISIPVNESTPEVKKEPKHKKSNLK